MSESLKAETKPSNQMNVKVIFLSFSLVIFFTVSLVLCVQISCAIYSLSCLTIYLHFICNVDHLSSLVSIDNPLQCLFSPWPFWLDNCLSNICPVYSLSVDLLSCPMLFCQKSQLLSIFLLRKSFMKKLQLIKMRLFYLQV